MALQGTIDTFDLAEVIRMLADGTKTGRLELSGDRGTGSLWFTDGRLVASESDDADPTADHATVLFQLLRFGEGSFVFDQDAAPGEAGAPVDADPVLEEAGRRLDEWREIEAVVPSLGHRAELRTELAPSEVVIDQAAWQAVAAIGGGRRVEDLGRSLDQDELDVSRTVKTLVELGLVEVAGPEPDEIDDGGPGGTALEPELSADATGSVDLAAGEDSNLVPEWIDAERGQPVGAAEEAVDATARDQLDALASGFGLTDEPLGDDFSPVGTTPAVEPTGGVEDLPADGAGSFPIEEAEAAGEATTPLFAHDAPDGGAADAVDRTAAPQPDEAAEVARQLANLSPEAARAVAAAARATTDEERDAALAVVAEDGDEPLDPDLLRSFLSSVRQ